MKPKFGKEDAHFSGKQFTLHCDIVKAEGPSMSTTLMMIPLSTLFVHHVLTDIITIRNINNQSIIT